VDSLPTLPNASAAEIERARKRVISNRQETYPVLFEREESFFEIASRIGKGSHVPVEPMPATLKDELERYAGALFDAEARTIIKHAESAEVLKVWLNSVAQRIQNEVTGETIRRSKLHDIHCQFQERRVAIAGALENRGRYWLAIADADSNALIARNSAARIKLAQTLSQARALLLGHENPPDSVVKHIDANMPRVPDTTAPSLQAVAQFPKRAIWLHDRLKERVWDHNEPYRHGGPDRKIVQKILNGDFVRPDTLRKLIHSLNQHKFNGKTILASDVPSD
jgi:hypothetical protein